MENESTLIGQFLVAMPSLTDPRFEKSVILITSHNPEGATGLIINKPFHTNLNNIINRIGVSDEISRDDIDVLNGGPVDADKGIILHNSEFTSLGTTKVHGINCSITATKEALSLLLKSESSIKANLYLGYSGWGPDQLDKEIKSNDWLISPGNEEIIFNKNYEIIWSKVIMDMGLSLSSISAHGGIA